MLFQSKEPIVLRVFYFKKMAKKQPDNIIEFEGTQDLNDLVEEVLEYEFEESPEGWFHLKRAKIKKVNK